MKQRLEQRQGKAYAKLFASGEMAAQPCVAEGQGQRPKHGVPDLFVSRAIAADGRRDDCDEDDDCYDDDDDTEGVTALSQDLEASIEALVGSIRHL